MIRFATLTEKSSDHSENQDFVLRSLHPSSKQQYLCFLADGQGGPPDGALASRLACEFTLEKAKARSREDLALASTWRLKIKAPVAMECFVAEVISKE